MNFKSPQFCEPASPFRGQPSRQIWYPPCENTDSWDISYTEPIVQVGTSSTSDMYSCYPTPKQVESQLPVAGGLWESTASPPSSSIFQVYPDQAVQELASYDPVIPGGQHPIAKRDPSVRRRYTQEKWDTVQPLIKLLYIDQGLPLSETMKIMEQNHGFIASYVYLNLGLRLLIYLGLSNIKTRSSCGAFRRTIRPVKICEERNIGDDVTRDNHILAW